MLVGVTLLAGCPTVQPPAAAVLEGAWATTGDEGGAVTLTFDNQGMLVEVAGVTTTGIVVRLETPNSTSTVDGNAVTFTIPRGAATITFEGALSVDHNRLEGTLSNELVLGDNITVTVPGGSAALTRISDPCEGVTCAPGRFCTGGTCIECVADADCGPLETCRNNACEGEDQDTVCDSGACADDDALSQECATFLTACLINERQENTDECLLVAFFKCHEDDAPDDVDEGLLCSSENCSDDADLAQKCETFLGVCLAETIGNRRECVGAAFLICRNSFDDPCDGVTCPDGQICSEGTCVECAGDADCGTLQTCENNSCVGEDQGTVCDSGACADDDSQSKECANFLTACLIDESQENADECLLVAFFICHEDDVPGDTDEETVCTREKCGDDADLAQECQALLVSCLAGIGSEERCIGGAFFFCGDLFD